MDQTVQLEGEGGISGQGGREGLQRAPCSHGEFPLIMPGSMGHAVWVTAVETHYPPEVTQHETVPSQPRKGLTCKDPWVCVQKTLDTEVGLECSETGCGGQATLMRTDTPNSAHTCFSACPRQTPMKGRPCTQETHRANAAGRGLAAQQDIRQGQAELRPLQVQLHQQVSTVAPKHAARERDSGQ